MIHIKTAQFNQQQGPDFQDVGIRRLMGILADTQSYTNKSIERLQQYLSNNQTNLSLEDMQNDEELKYWLSDIYGQNWERIVI